MFRSQKTPYIIALLAALLTAAPVPTASAARRKPPKAAAKPRPIAKKSVAPPAPQKNTASFDEWLSEDVDVKPLPAKAGIVQANAASEKATGSRADANGELVIPEVKTTPVVVINGTTRNDSASKFTVTLAENNAARMPIVISPQASPTVKAVAQELAAYLGRISGATFAVEEGNGASGIVLGNIKEFPNAELNEALRIKNSIDGKEAYAIRTGEKRLLLLGATDLGTSHAAYRLLRELGCRWFFPDPAWEVVPSTPLLQFGRDITDRPAMLSRVIWFEAGSGGAEQEENYKKWRRRNGAAESFQVNAGHNLFVIPTTFPEEFKAHPEYYAKTADGKINEGDIELTNPAVRKLIVEYARRYFKQNPVADMVSIDPTDSHTHSQSAESLKTPYSDQIFGVANEVARMLQREFPGKMVGLYSYNAHYDPPSFKLEPNVHVQMTSMSINPKYTPEQRTRLWPQRSSNLGVYEYYSVFLWSGDSLPGSYTNDVRGSQKHIRDELVARGVISMSAESTSSWGSNGRGYYFANALMWNPDLDIEALLADFYEKAFGPAGPAMRRYYDRLDPASEPLMSGHLYGLSFRDIDEASKAAVNRPDVQARLDQLKMYLRFIYIQNNKGQRSEVKDHVIDDDMMMENLYRTAPHALTAWSMIVQTWQGNDVYARGKKWPEPVPYTHDEIEAEFQEGLKAFAPMIRDVGPKTVYSTDVVPIRWTAEQKGKVPEFTADFNQAYQGSMRYVLYSAGEPLEFITEAGDAWGYRTSFTVTDAAGNILSQGKPEPKVQVKHKISVPKPGLYYLNYNDPGAYWTFIAKPTLKYSITLLPSLTNGRTAHVLDSMYFYVPKGTQNIEYFPTNGQWVFGPDGSDQKRVEKANDYIKIPVPAGMDGKIWNMRSFDLGKIHFFNTPSYISPTPEGVVVPREVAEKDGLAIRK